MEENKGVIEKADYIDYEFGDLYLQCSCGRKQPLPYKGVEGLQIFLAPTNVHDLTLVCDSCGHSMRLFFEEAENIGFLKARKNNKGSELAVDDVKPIEENVGDNKENI